MPIASLTIFDSDRSLSLFLPVQGIERISNPREGSPFAHPYLWEKMCGAHFAGRHSGLKR